MLKVICSFCRSLLAGDSERTPTDYVLNRLQAGSYIPNQPMLRRGLAALLILLLLGGVGLAATMSYRVFSRGNLRAGGTILPSGEARFDSLRIGIPGKPLDAQTPFFIRLSNGKAMESTDLTAELVASFATAEEKLPRNSEWGAGAVEYRFEGMVFVFREGRCVCFRANWIQLPNRSFRPEIGSAQSGAFYKMPLSQAQLEAIFGKADQIEDKSSL